MSAPDNVRNRRINRQISREEDLHTSEQTFQNFAELLPQPVFEMDVAGNITFVNGQGLKTFGYAREEFEKGLTAHQVLIPQDYQRAIGAVLKVVIGPEPVNEEFTAVRKDGSRFPVIIYAVPIMENGKPRGIRGIVTDITAQKRTEETLKESEERYRTAIEHSNDGVAIMKGDEHVYVNQKFLDMFGYDAPEEILGKPTFTTVHPEDREKVIEINRRRQRGESVPSRYDFKGLRKDGRVIYIEVSATKVLYQREARSLAYLRDVTERKQAEEILRVTQFSVDHASEAVVWMDAEGHFIYANEAACEASGYSQDELRSMRISDIDVDLTQEAWCTRWVEKKQRGAITFESRYRSRDGRMFPVEIKADYAKVGDREYSFAFIRDITERKRAEGELNKQRETFFTILENDPSGVALIDKNGTYQYINPEFTNLTGYTLEDVPTGREWFRKAYPDPAYQGNVIETWKKNRLSPGRHIDVAFTITRKDGQKREIEFRTTFLEDHTITVLNDVTERKQAEEQITASLREKEALLKEIHHRVKNNLQIVSSLLHLQARNTEHLGALGVLRDSQNRVRSMALIHEKLYGSPNLASVDMAEYARALALQVFESYRDGGQSIRLRTNLDNISLDISRAIPCGLIINELVSNALKHAFPEGRGGEITLQLQRQNGDKMTLVVADSGIGLPEHVDFQRSPSLGLNLVCTLVEQLDGTIELDGSAGTAFEITFG